MSAFDHPFDRYCSCSSCKAEVVRRVETINSKAEQEAQPIFDTLRAGEVWKDRRTGRYVVVVAWSHKPNRADTYSNPSVLSRTVKPGEVFEIGQRPPRAKDGQKAPERWIKAQAFTKRFMREW